MAASKSTAKWDGSYYTCPHCPSSETSVFINHLDLYDHLGSKHNQTFIYGRLEDVRAAKVWVPELADRKNRNQECKICLRKFNEIGLKTHMSLHRKRRHLYPEDVSEEEFYKRERDYAETCGKRAARVACSSIRRDVSIIISHMRVRKWESDFYGLYSNECVTLSSAYGALLSSLGLCQRQRKF